MTSQTAENSGESGSNVAADEANAKRIARAAKRNNVYSWLIYHIARLIYRTLRFHDYEVPLYETNGKGCIYVTWHGRTMLAANYLCAIESTGRWYRYLKTANCRRRIASSDLVSKWFVDPLARGAE